jgi:ACR3 family arsenite efflux pump ArsB
MMARAVVEILKAIAIIIGLPLVSGFVVEGVVFLFSNRDVEGAFASGAAGIAVGLLALIIGVIIVLRRIADFDFGD